jgi:thiamine pyrophosphokinase
VESPQAIGRAVVVSGGLAPDAAEVGPLPADAFVIAADSGLDHAAALGVRVDVLVGDLDSASAPAVRAAEAAGIRIERHPVDKEATDLELALDFALAQGANRVTVVSGGGGRRLDHHLAELVLLASARYAPLRIDARIGPARVVPIHAGEGVSLVGAPGAVLTLLALGGPAAGITTTGLRWPLRAETLQPGSTRGVSNEIVFGPVCVELASGILLAVGSKTISRGERRPGSPSGPGCS